MAPGSQRGVQVVVPDATAARKPLLDHGVPASDVDIQPVGSSVPAERPDGQGAAGPDAARIAPYGVLDDPAG